MRALALLLAGTLTTGCGVAAIVVPVTVDAILGGIGIYQRREGRQTQEAQTEEIRRLREEIARGRPRPPAPGLPSGLVEP